MANERMALPPHLARLRRRMLAVSIPVAAVLVLLACYGLFQSIAAQFGERSFDDGNWEGAKDAFAATDTINAIERWRAPYDLGTAKLAADAPVAAILDLDRAWALVPHGGEVPSNDECLIAINLSLAHEVLGDRSVESADAASAAESYQEAIDTIAGCTSDSRDEDPSADSEQSAQAQEAKERQERKLDDAQGNQGGGEDGGGGGEDGEDGDDGGEEPNPSPSPSPSPSAEPSEQPSPSPSPSPDPIDQIQDRNDEANDQWDEDQQQGGGGYGGGDGW